MKKKYEEITMEVIVNIAESVDNIIKFTYDVPRNHTNDKFPVLDVEININKKENNRIDYEFYEKPTNNKRIILEVAALSSKQKRTILTQECLRRLRNTKIELGEAIKIKHLNNFMLKMKNSGYPKNYRTEILYSTLVAFDQILSDDSKGVKPLFRSRSWNREERNRETGERNQG